MKVNKKLLITVPAIILLLSTGSAAFYYYQRYTATKNELSQYSGDPNIVAMREKLDLIYTIGQLVNLPEDEEPTIATIADAYKLRDQAFFAGAENGDKVLIYTKAAKAILYRPSTNRVIEVAPVNINDIENTVNKSTDAATVSSDNYSVLGDTTHPTQETDKPLRIALWNGTHVIAGLAGKTEVYLNDTIQNYNFEISEKGDSTKIYDKNMVIALTEFGETAADYFVQLLEGEKTEFPTDEIKPEADLLIILGKDSQ